MEFRRVLFRSASTLFANNGGSITVTGGASITADAFGGNAGGAGTGGAATGGSARLAADGGSINLLRASLQALSSGGDGNTGGAGFGGTASVSAVNGGSISATNELFLIAEGPGGAGSLVGGTGTGGLAAAATRRGSAPPPIGWASPPALPAPLGAS